MFDVTVDYCYNRIASELINLLHDILRSMSVKPYVGYYSLARYT